VLADLQRALKNGGCGTELGINSVDTASLLYFCRRAVGAKEMKCSSSD
jgi:hypothetical protein